MTTDTLVQAASICVVYADDAIIVLNKPSGLLSVPGRGPEKQDCLSARVQAQFSDALVVHRLDMATSGLMVMARGAAVSKVRSNCAWRWRGQGHAPKPSMLSPSMAMMTMSSAAGRCRLCNSASYTA